MCFVHLPKTNWLSLRVQDISHSQHQADDFYYSPNHSFFTLFPITFKAISLHHNSFNCNLNWSNIFNSLSTLNKQNKQQSFHFYFAFSLLSKTLDIGLTSEYQTCTFQFGGKKLLSFYLLVKNFFFVQY